MVKDLCFINSSKGDASADKVLEYNIEIPFEEFLLLEIFKS